MHLQQQGNVTLSENSWNDVVNKYKLYREMEVVIREASGSSSHDNGIGEKKSHKGSVWAYRALVVAGAFSIIGNLPVQSFFLSTQNKSTHEIFEPPQNKNSFIAPVTAKSIATKGIATKEIVAKKVKLADTTTNTTPYDKGGSDSDNIHSYTDISDIDIDINSLASQEEQSLELTLPKQAIKTYASHTLKNTTTKWATYHVKSYDNLTNIFHKLGHQSDLKTLKADKEIFAELKILNKNGAIVRANSNSEGKLAELVFTHDNINSYVLNLKDGKYKGSWKKGVFETRQARASFTINNGLFFDGRKVGIQNRVIRQIVKVFDWDIDFSHDIRVGDKVTAIFEEIYHDGDKVGSKNLLAAEFINKKRVLRTIRYAFKDGRSDFFTPDGHEMKKAFIRTPIAHARISSNFNPGRLHPVLHKMRAHKGTDFAARRGTSIMATGNATVTFVGRKGGYGRMVILKHREGYSTRYGHMSRFKKGLKAGDKVYQGDIIGYVGSSGLATGPHCHYELRKNGKAIDPMKAHLPNSMSLARRDLQDFRNKAINLVLQLNVLHRFVEADIDIDSVIGG